MVALLAGLAVPAAAGPRAQVKWFLSTWGAPRGLTKSLEVLADTVARETGNGFTIEIAYGEALSPQRDNLDSISVGIIEAGHICPNNHPGKTPLMLALELPFLPIADMDAAQRLAQVYYRHPAVVKEMDRYDAVALMQTTTPRYELMGNGPPPVHLDAYRGMRIRALGAVGEAARALGAAPTSVPTPEIYNALDRGMFEAATIPFPYAFGAYRIYEIADWYTLNLNLAMTNCFLAVNKHALAALPDVYRAALMAALPGAAQAQIAFLQNEEAMWLEKFAAAGLTPMVYDKAELDDFKLREAQKVWDRWIAEADRRGLPGREMLAFILAEGARASEQSAATGR